MTERFRLTIGQLNATVGDLAGNAELVGRWTARAAGAAPRPPTRTPRTPTPRAGSASEPRGATGRMPPPPTPPSSRAAQSSAPRVNVIA